jgi:4-phospho-D-threonate 3-dehydrogenase / 4-phospho-D-erythronate 3-dehydrogenase
MRSFPESNIGQRPRIGITMGDPAGIGAEIIVKALAHDQI